MDGTRESSVLLPLLRVEEGTLPPRRPPGRCRRRNSSSQEHADREPEKLSDQFAETISISAGIAAFEDEASTFYISELKRSVDDGIGGCTARLSVKLGERKAAEGDVVCLSSPSQTVRHTHTAQRRPDSRATSHCMLTTSAARMFRSWHFHTPTVGGRSGLVRGRSGQEMNGRTDV